MNETYDAVYNTIRDAMPPAADVTKAVEVRNPQRRAAGHHWHSHAGEYRRVPGGVPKGAQGALLGDIATGSRRISARQTSDLPFSPKK